MSQFKINDNVYFFDKKIRNGVISKIKTNIYKSKVFIIEVNGWKHPIKLTEKYLFNSEKETFLNNKKRIIN